MDLKTDETSGIHQRRLDRRRMARLDVLGASGKSSKPHLKCGFFNVPGLSRASVFALGFRTSTIKHISPQGI
jgi:hypothetical protein